MPAATPRHHLTYTGVEMESAEDPFVHASFERIASAAVWLVASLLPNRRQCRRAELLSFYPGGDNSWTRTRSFGRCCKTRQTFHWRLVRVYVRSAYFGSDRCSVACRTRTSGGVSLKSGRVFLA